MRDWWWDCWPYDRAHFHREWDHFQEMSTEVKARLQSEKDLKAKRKAQRSGKNKPGWWL